MTDHDVIIIGSGSVGTPTAYFLAEAGMDVLVVDELASSGQGQNKAAIGGARATHSDPAKIMTCSRSLEIFSTWKERTGTDIGWKQGGYCFPVYRENEEGVLKGILPIQKEHRLEIDWYDADGISRFVPGIATDGLIGGTYSPNDGQVSPLMASESFQNEAAALGARFMFNESVTGLIMEGEGDDRAVTGITLTSGEEISAESVVNAAGAHASDICRIAGLDVPILPDSHEAGITSPVKPFLDPLVVDLRPGGDGRTSNFYFGQNSEGQIIFCYTPSPLLPGEDKRATSEFMPTIARRLVGLIPRLKNLMVRRTWRGLYPMTQDGVPVVGQDPCVRGFYMGIGMCGQGLMMGPGVGESLASVIAKGRPVIDEDVFDLLSPTRDFACGQELLK